VESRLVVGIACGVHSGGINVTQHALSELTVLKILLPSFWLTAQPGYMYRYSRFSLRCGNQPVWTKSPQPCLAACARRFYFAFDDVDPVYNQTHWRNAVEAAISNAIAAEDAKRWHPDNYTLGSIDPSALLVSVHWVSCDYTHKPAWAQSDAVMAAYKEGADYVLRINDDTQLPSRKDWVEAFIDDLRSRRPVPNLGVVGPLCKQGNTLVLTHDFTHRTHAVLFGFHYPRSLPDW
jgi:hypothetical protein